MFDVDIDIALDNVSYSIPQTMGKITDDLEWLAVELEDYQDGEIDVPDEFISQCIELISNTKFELDSMSKKLRKQINNLIE